MSTHIHAHLPWIMYWKEEGKLVSYLSFCIRLSIPLSLHLFIYPSVFFPRLNLRQRIWTSVSLPGFLCVCVLCLGEISLLPRLACVIEPCLTALHVMYWRQGLCAGTLLAELAWPVPVPGWLLSLCRSPGRRSVWSTKRLHLPAAATCCWCACVSACFSHVSVCSGCIVMAVYD